MRKGVNRWCFPAGWSIRTCLAVARRAGFDGIELVMGDPDATAPDAPAGPMAHLASPAGYLGLHPYPTPELHPNSAPAQVRALGEEIRADGLEVPSVTSALPFLHPLTAGDEAERARGTELYRTALRFAGELGAETVLLVPGVIQPGSRYDEALARARDCIASLLPDAERHGVTLAVENVWNKMLQSPLEFRDFVDGFDSPWVRAYLDVGNVISTGYGEDWIRLLGPRLDKVHVCNFRGETGSLPGFTRHLLDGDVDWPAITRALRDAGYDGWLTAEVTPPSPHHPEKTLRDIASTVDWILGRGDPTPGTTAEAPR